ncbi:Cyclase family protein [Sulfidibacter corallicola]|uniref:Cyclase family protein n=1 Tax=Sulfidibacter corallicola TaxID=2818388 RepID=A0A8A4TRV8_SULCO|nr:cyclase family protein [Sulfidibacter corallicola]QTD49275.1 cyclase family protein [Sulfidibacter corallicola]
MSPEIKPPKMIDLNHPISAGMITYRGLPGPVIEDFIGYEASHDHYAEGTEFHIGRIDMIANTGTYIDTPIHRYRSGYDLAELPLAHIAHLPGRVFHAPAEPRVLGPELFEGVDIAGKAVLIHTGHARWWGDDRYFRDHRCLDEAAAELLCRQGARLVGIDSLNIDDTVEGGRPVHSLLLEAGIPIVEHMCGLDQLPDEGFLFYAVPPRIRGLGSFPTRAFAIVNSEG